MIKAINEINQNKIYNRIIKALIFGAGGAVISKGILMIFNIIVARITTSSQYGIYSIINNTVQTFTIFAGAGLGATLSRYVALYREKNKPMAGIMIKTLLTFNLITSIIVVVFVYVFSDKLSNLISQSVNISNYLKLTSIIILFTSLSLVFQNILQGFENYNRIALYQLISSIIMLISGTVLTINFKTTGAVLSLLILNVLTFMFFYITTKKTLNENQIKQSFQINDVVKKSIKNVALPAFLASIFVVPIIWVTNSMFTKINGYSDFAAFSVCFQWFTILNYIPQQFGQVKPIFTQLYDNKNMKEFKKVTREMIIFSALFSFLTATIIAIFSSLILKTYGNYYLNYNVAFIIMLIASVVYSIQSQFGSIFYAIGKIWMSFILNVIWAIIFVLSFLLLGSKGVIGYALTYLISYFIYSAFSVICFRKIVNERGLNKND